MQEETTYMKLLVIIGSSAVGKMTVGQELMNITDMRLFHNHMSIELVLSVFGERVNAVDKRIREVIFEEFAKSELYGMIFTFMWAFDKESNWKFIDYFCDIFRRENADIYFVELVASQEVRLQRNVSENRLLHKPSKRDIPLSTQRLLDDDAQYRCVSYEGEIPFEHYIKIDNTDLPPDMVAQMIKERFLL